MEGNVKIQVLNVVDLDNDDLLKRSKQDPIFMLMPTYIEGGAGDDAAWFYVYVLCTLSPFFFLLS